MQRRAERESDSEGEGEGEGEGEPGEGEGEAEAEGEGMGESPERKVGGRETAVPKPARARACPPAVPFARWIVAITLRPRARLTMITTTCS